MASYLITGGCGFIGVNLIRRLRERGTSVRVLDNLTTGHCTDLDGLGVTIDVGDIRDRQAVKKSLEGVDVVVHLAAHTRVVESVSDPALNFDVNARGTLNLLEESRAARVQKFIFASTGGAILGEQAPPVHEEMVPRPISPYGASKLAGEAYCSAYAGAYGLTTIALRFANVYGPYSYHKGSVVAQFYKNLLQGQELTVYGDGSQTRDFVFVEDLVEAILLAAERGAAGEVFQIASGQETSVAELIKQMEKTCGVTVSVRHEPARAGEISRNYAVIEKASRVLGYKPKVQLADGLARTWQWFLSSSSSGSPGTGALL